MRGEAQIRKLIEELDRYYYRRREKLSAVQNLYKALPYCDAFADGGSDENWERLESSLRELLFSLNLVFPKDM